MAKVFDSISDNHRAFIEKQKMFFTASAPLDPSGHVNLSPKGMDSFRILSDSKAAYMDINGSGNETSAHILENGRITIMFCAFDGPPNILKLYGKGYTVLPGDKQWEELSALFDLPLPARQIIVTEVHKVITSCGYGVPFMDYKGERDQAIKWCDNKGEEGLKKYQADNNLASLDGLPTALALQS